MKNFYKNKKVLITGNTGFKGSWLTVILNKLGAEIIGYSNSFVSSPNMFEILKLDKNIIFIKNDIRDFKSLMLVFKKYKPEVVFHLAAQPLVKKSYQDPLLTISTNVCGSLNILECCRLENSVKSLIYVTSDKCYENQEWTKGYKETDRIGGYDPYSSSKAAAENIFNGYYKSFFKNKIGAASVRAGNVIGGGDWSNDRLIPDCIKAIKDKKKIIIRNPNSTRPWQHVLDPLFGYLKLAFYLDKDKNKYSGAWNFGRDHNQAISVNKVVKVLCSNFQYNKNIIYKKEKNNKNIKEAKLLSLDCSKSNKILKWKPILNSKKSVEFTCDWYKDFFLNKDMKNITLKQVNYFFDHYF
jgi:CDP-glucose 4,6-dehydratase